MGYDVDAIAGYDFGMFRLEAELGYKRAKADELQVDQGLIDLIEDETGEIITDDDVDIGGSVKVLSLMGNGLLDFGGDGLGFYAGGGFGRAKVKAFGESDSAWAMQLIAGVRTAISDNIDAGLKYRYFRTGKLDFESDLPFDGGNVFAGSNDRFSSHSLLASLIFNFGHAAPPPPPPPPPVVEAPPPPPPATQTCPDGSVILATDSCPLPPPPPPPPPPAPERG
jgi:opacity protein-like surface antigen